MVLSFVNLKGGVGKTTTAVSLGAVFARSGLSVLLVDLDPQGSAGVALGVSPTDVARGLGAVLADSGRLEEVLLDTSEKGVTLAPADERLADLDMTLARRKDPTGRLATALRPGQKEFDVVLVDCPPGLTLLPAMGLAASGAFLVPTTAQALAVESLKRLLGGVERLRARARLKTRLAGIVLAQVDRRVRLTEPLVKEIRWRHGRDVLLTEIPVNARLAEASRHGRSILDYESWSTGGQAYSKLGAEVLRRVRELGLV